MTLALTPAVADPLSGTDEYPDVAFLARNDVPFDAQTAASMAAQLGAPIFITNPNVLADAARDGIAGLNPDVIIVAGGIFAVSDAVANEAAAACEPDCAVDRRAGLGRDETAAELAAIAADYGFDRPVLQGDNQVLGDVHVGGTVRTDAITIQDTGLVSGLNADRVDGMHADDFLGATDKAADSDLLDGKDSTDFLGATDKAADSDLLDGKDSTTFVRTSGDTMTGSLTVPSVIYSSPREHVVNVGGFAFQPSSSGASIVLSDSSGATGNSGSNTIWAAASVPDGATISKVACVFHDASATADVGCRLRVTPVEQTVVNSISSFLTSSGSSGFQTVEDTTLTNADVDNAANNIYVQVSPTGGNWDGTNTTVKSVIITYTLPEAP